jgi:hypothetical protein
MGDVIPFGEYRPDVADFNTTYTGSINNVIPRADGYGPFPSFQALTSTLPAPCCGGFYGRRTDGSVAIFAATATDLYLLNNTTLAWANVSKGGVSYTSLPASALWQFEQFNNFVLAVQANANPQYYDLTSSTKFADLAGSPPAASYIAIVNRFVLLSGLVSLPYRIVWSGLNDPTNWTAGVNSSDFQDFPDGGPVRPCVGGELGYVFQDQCIRRMVFAPGSDVIFSIDRVAKDVGLLAPYGVVSAGEDIYFLSTKGFQRLSAGQIIPIGREKVDRSFAANWDSSSPQFMIGAHAPESGLVIWVYRSATGSAANWDSGLLYDPVLDRWAPFSLSGQFIVSMARPGLTLEGLDAIAPGVQTITGAVGASGLIRLTVGSTASYTTNQIVAVSGVGGTTEANGNWPITVIDGTHVDLQGSAFVHAYTSGGIIGGSLDLLPFSLDNVAGAQSPKISIFDTTATLGFLTGPNLEAILETAEQSQISQRMFIQGFFPLTDAGGMVGNSPAIVGNVSKRENLVDDPGLTLEQPMNARGFIPARADTRHARARVRVLANANWTYLTGISPLVKMRGKR